MTIDPKRLADICKLRQEAPYGYATANGQVYARDVQELLNDRNDLLAELERQRARADLAHCVADELRRVIRAFVKNEIGPERALQLSRLGLTKEQSQAQSITELALAAAAVGDKLEGGD